LNQDRGDCNNMTSKFFYDKQDGICKQFMYNGCEGNENRFDSKHECEQQCSNAQGNCKFLIKLGKSIILCFIF